MRRRHGDTELFLIGNEVLVITSNLLQTKSIRVDANFGERLAEFKIPVEVAGKNGERLFRYDYLFRNTGLPPHKPDPNHLIELGLAMTHTAGSTSTSSLPAGYTFLGQFIDHDLSFNANDDLSIGGPPVQLQSKRSPSFDLDSLYGFEPDKVMNTELGREIYDGAKLKEGETSIDNDVFLASAKLKYLHDVPRLPGSKQAALVDARNDENLAVAQTHLAFIKFHNAVLKQLPGGGSTLDLFWKAREKVIQQYQRVILDDFLPTILDPIVVKEMQDVGPTIFRLKPKEEPFMPLEFAVAAFRMGHSLVASQYEWNAVFQSTNPRPQPASLEELFIFSGSGSLNNFFSLTSNWIIDWTRFFNFSGFPVQINKPSSQAGTIDAVIARRLASLPPIPNHPASTASLAVRNLLRGLSVQLPAGQHIAKFLKYPVLEPREFADLPYYDTLRKFGFDEITPLWLYVLHEAKIQNRGERLGLVGSRIVAETILTLLQMSRNTILPPGTKWQPPKEKFGMAHFLVFVNEASDKKDFLNPLG